MWLRNAVVKMVQSASRRALEGDLKRVSDCQIELSIIWFWQYGEILPVGGLVNLQGLHFLRSVVVGH
jgi:hypothetical protein